MVVSASDARVLIAARIAAVAAAGLAVGVATSYLQGVLPGQSNFLANSGAVWSVLAFGLAWWAVRGRSLGTGVAAGVAALVAEVLGYYAIASPLRDIATTGAERTLWIVAGIVVGTAVGAGAHIVRYGTAPRPALASGAVCGLPVGEGLHVAVALGYAAQATIEFAVGAIMLIVAVVVIDRSWRGAVATAVAALITAAVVAFAYSAV